MARILVVEDSPTQAEKLQMILEGDGLEARVAHDGRDALAMLEDEAFDMVVSDIVMPGMSGYDLCRGIKERAGLRNVPVILLTTRKDPMDIFRGLECGADGFYTKPYDAARLLERIRHILHNRMLRSQGKLRLGVEVSMFGKTFVIGSEREQILDLLVSTFEDIVQANVELEKTRDDLNATKAKLDEYVQLLESRVRSSEGRYRAVFDGIAEGVLLLDGDLRIASANPAAERMFERTTADIAGRDFRSLVPERFRGDQEAFRPLRPLPGSRGNAPAAVEITGLRGSGEEFPLGLALSEVLIDDERLLVAVTRDLTAEQQAEQQLRQMQKIEAIGQLTGGVAHDFNNLLTVIAGNAEELVGRLAGDPVLSELATMIDAAAQRGAELTGRLLAFARRQPLEPRPLDIDALVRGMEGLLGRSLGEQIGVRIVPGRDTWSALVDPAQLESSLLNLAVNARDAMGERGGTLHIETRNATIEAGDPHARGDLTPGDYVVIAVSDTGEGIPPQLLDRVLEPFFTTKPAGRGTGMGLPMVYGFVKQSGGHLAIYSEPGEGTTVRMYLPRCASTGEATPEACDEIPASSGTETILLVEDDELVRRYAEEQLKSLGYRVLLAENGPAGVEVLCSTATIDLLLTDVVMPGGMNGKDLADAAARLRPGLKVLFTSGYAEDAIVHNGRLDPGVRLLGKPYRRSQLARSVREALDD